MKSFGTIILAILLTGFFSSCKKDQEKITMKDVKPILASDAKAPLILLQVNDAQTALTFSYDNVNFGFSDALGYVLRIAPAGQNFRADSTIDVNVDRAALKKSFTVLELNKLLINMFQPAERTLTLEARIETTAGKVYSNVVPLTIKTYEDWPKVLPYTNAPDQLLYIPGAYQTWDPTAAIIAKVYSANADKKYEGSINLPDKDNGFKFTPARAWDNSYGSTANSGNAGTLAYNKGDNFIVTGKGYYRLDVDLTAMTWKATLNNYSIIGDAGVDWSTDIDLEFDPATQTLFKVLPMKVGEWKFRKNHAWNGGDFPGTNIKITEAGNYKVLLDMRVPSDPYWKIIKQ